MSAPRPPFVGPECSIGECGLCRGPEEITVGGGIPVEVIRCDHSCHKTPQLRAEITLPVTNSHPAQSFHPDHSRHGGCV